MFGEFVFEDYNWLLFFFLPPLFFFRRIICFDDTGIDHLMFLYIYLLVLFFFCVTVNITSRLHFLVCMIFSGSTSRKYGHIMACVS